MDHAQLSHPGAGQLAAFALGKLSKADAAAITTHLAACPACRGALAALPRENLNALASSTISGKSQPSADRQTLPSTIKPPAAGLDTVKSAAPGQGTPAAGGMPDRFGHYQVVKRLGQGGMGSVYLAHDTRLDRRVALKVPRFSVDDGPEIRERFYREARAAAKIDHPNICHVYDVGENQGIPYLAMRYIEGSALSEFIKPDRPMAQQTAAAIAFKVAQALQVAHSHGIIHRDLKPSNIMILKGREPIVTDFGLARQTDAKAARLTRTGAVLGTPHYMAPEQARGDLEAVGPASDIYSLGVILYEMVTGRVPFDGPVAVVLSKVLSAEPPPPSQYRADLEPALAAICAKAMAKTAAERYASMGDFAAALSAYVKGESQPVSAGARPAPAPPRPGADNKVARAGEPSGIRKTPARPSVRDAARPGEKKSSVHRAPAGKAPGRPARRLLLVLGGAVILGAAVTGVFLFLYRDDSTPPVDSTDLLVTHAPSPDLTTPKVEPKPPAVVEPKTTPTVEPETVPAIEPKAAPPVETEKTPTPEKAAPSVEPKAPPVEPKDTPVSEPKIEPTVEPKEIATVEPKTKVEPKKTDPDLPAVKAPPVVEDKPPPKPAVAKKANPAEKLPDAEKFLDPDLNAADFEKAMKAMQERRVADGMPRLPGFPGDEAPTEPSKAVEVGRLVGHTGGVVAAVYSPEGQRLATGSEDNTIRLWDIAKAKSLAVLRGHTHPVQCVAFSSTGKNLASGSSFAFDGMVKLWDLTTGKELPGIIRWNERISGTAVEAVAFSPNSKLLAICGTGPVRLWNLTTYQQQAAFKWQESSPSHAHAVAFSPDSKVIAVGCYEMRETVHLWKTAVAEEPTVLVGNKEAIGLSHDAFRGAVVYSKDGKLLARATSNGANSGTGSLMTWDVDADGQATLKGSHELPKGGVYALAILPNGTLLVAATDGSTRPFGFEKSTSNVRLWDSVSGKTRTLTTGHGGNVLSLAFSPDGTVLATGSADTSVKLWKLDIP